MRVLIRSELEQEPPAQEGAGNIRKTKLDGLNERGGRGESLAACGTITEVGAEGNDALLAIARPMASKIAGEYRHGGRKAGLDRDDLVQVMLKAVIEQRGGIDVDDRGVRTYIAKAMRSAARNAIRDRKRLKRGGDRTVLPIEACARWLPDESRDERADEVLAETVGAAFCGMSEAERAYCDMAMDGKSQAAIGRALGLTKRACDRIRQNVRQQLQEIGIEGCEWN